MSNFSCRFYMGHLFTLTLKYIGTNNDKNSRIIQTGTIFSSKSPLTSSDFKPRPLPDPHAMATTLRIRCLKCFFNKMSKFRVLCGKRCFIMDAGWIFAKLILLIENTREWANCVNELIEPLHSPVLALSLMVRIFIDLCRRAEVRPLCQNVNKRKCGKTQISVYSNTLLLPHRSMKTLARDVNVRSETNVYWKLVFVGITRSTY